MVGKWHLCPDDEMNLASTRRNWPSGRGFERWYGFLGAETSQWYPDLVYDNHLVDQPTLAGGGLPPHRGPHRQGDRVHQGRQGDRAGEAVLPLLRARRLPRAAPRSEGVDRQVQGPLRHGLRGDARADARPPEGARARPGGHRAAADQPDRHARDAHRARTASRSRRSTSRGRGTRCRTTRRRCSAGWRRSTPDSSPTPTTRSAACSASSRSSAGARTRSSIVVSDNGASGEGGPNGSVNEMKFANGIPDTIEANLPLLDELGGPKTYNHYPNGWAMAFNTPFKMWKRYEFNGGTSDPCIISWPAGMKAKGEIRDQYHHAIDLVPTILDVLGVEPPETIKGHVQSAVRRRQHALELRRRRRRRRRGRRSSTRCSARGRSGTTAGRPSRTTRRSPAGATSTTTSGSCTTPRSTGRSCTTSPPSSPTRSGSS